MHAPARPSAGPEPDGLSARIARLHADVEGCAELAGLRYVDEAALDGPGIRRQRSGRRFRYRTPSRRPLNDPAQLERIAGLAVPPAWRRVWICPHADGHILAVGEDARGRTQYLYHERWREVRGLLNAYRLIGVGESLPAVRGEVGQLRARALDRDVVVAAMVRILDATAIRIGNEVYAEENDSFGLSTLSRRHVQVSGDSIRMTFPAKSGKRADITLPDRAVAHVVERLLRQRSRRLFALDRQPVGSGEVNDALHEWTGAHVTAKDFRTWAGTLTAFAHLERHTADADRERVVIDAVDAAAELLGNTRAVARDSYVHPHVISAFLDGTFAEWQAASEVVRAPLLTSSERRLLAFLRTAWTKQDTAALRRRRAG